MNQELYKTRNVSSCVGAAYNLFITNLTKIACRLWMPILAFSVVYVLMSNTRLYLLLHVDELQQNLGMFIGLWCGNLFLNLLLLCSVAWNVSALINRLNSFGLKQNLRRGFVFIGFILCLAEAVECFYNHHDGDRNRCCCIPVLIGVFSLAIEFRFHEIFYGRWTAICFF